MPLLRVGHSAAQQADSQFASLQVTTTNVSTSDLATMQFPLAEYGFTPGVKLCQPVVFRKLVQYSVSNKMCIPAHLAAQQEDVRSGEETLAPLTTDRIGLGEF